LHRDGAVAAYGGLAADAEYRLVGLGPSFGTKFLYFCEPRPAQATALILDGFVAAALHRHAEFEVDATRWSSSSYGRHLDQMHTWAAALECEADDLECVIFQAEATYRRSQWAAKVGQLQARRRHSVW